ncbi:hypothetical protein ES702_06052 [subsurface metagenome]
MRKVFVAGLLVLGGLFFGKCSFAHHAMEYIEMESYTTAREGEFVFHLHYDYMVENKDCPGEDHWELTSGLSYGITDRLMVDIHTHFAKFGNALLVEEEQANYEPNGPSPFMEAVAFGLQCRVTENSPVDVAVACVYEVPFSRSKDLLDGEEVYEGILILGRDFRTHSNISLNLKYGKDGDETIKEWALGVKVPISDDPHGIAAGVEFLGCFEDFEDSWSILPGVYMPLGGENIIFKTGLEFGKGMESMRANTTLMYRF